MSAVGSRKAGYVLINPGTGNRYVTYDQRQFIDALY
jgi:hypothetical protein